MNFTTRAAHHTGNEILESPSKFTNERKIEMRFFKITSGDKEVFINLAHVVQAESDATGNTLTVRMVNGNMHVVTGDDVKRLRALLTSLVT